MRYAVYIILLLCCCSQLSGQQGSNPFEIESRLDSIYQSEIDPQSSKDKVIDVKNQENNPPSTGVFNSKGTSESSIIPPVAEEEDNQFEADDEKATSDINPFDVSHIPIRRSKLKKEANAFDTKKTVTKGESNSFLFILILISCFLIAIVINTQRGALSKIVKGITNENVLRLNHREEKKGINGHYFLLYLTYAINAAIFIYFIIYHFYDQSGWAVFRWCLAGVVMIYFLKHTFITFLGLTFPIQKEASFYSFTIQSFNLFIGQILIPFNLVIGFGPSNLATFMIYLTCMVILVLLIIRSFRGILIASRWISSNFFHFFLYLCAFEILPILLFIKVMGKF